MKFGKRIILGTGLVLGIVLSVGLPVLAATYSWTTEISVSEYGGSARPDGVPILVDFGIQGLVDLGYLESTGLDSRVRAADYDRPHTLEDSRLGLVVYTLTSYQTAVLDLYTGYSPLSTDFDLVVGPSGYVTITDHADLEFGNAFEIELKGFIDTSAGSDKNLVFKDGAFKIYVSAEDAVTASIFNANWVTTLVTATDIVSGIYTVKVVADGSTMKIYIDSVEKASIGVVAVVDTNDNWILMQNSSLLSLEFLKVRP